MATKPRPVRKPFTFRPNQAPPGRPKIKRIQQEYETTLRGIAKHVGLLIDAFPPGDLSFLPMLQKLLQDYAEALTPWAQRRARTMISDVNVAELGTWLSLSNDISAALRATMRNTPIGHIVRQLMADQVHLITSLPREAGQRVHDLTIEGVQSGTRFQEIVPMIKASGEVTQSRAVLIARTETSRTATALLQARCQSVGFETYIWMTAGDGDVRPGHQEMSGKQCEWANPPAVKENGKIMHFHAGCVWNCRCWCAPQIL